MLSHGRALAVPYDCGSGMKEGKKAAARSKGAHGVVVTAVAEVVCGPNAVGGENIAKGVESHGIRELGVVKRAEVVGDFLVEDVRRRRTGECPVGVVAKVGAAGVGERDDRVAEGDGDEVARAGGVGSLEAEALGRGLVRGSFLGRGNAFVLDVGHFLPASRVLMRGNVAGAVVATSASAASVGVTASTASASACSAAFCRSAAASFACACAFVSRVAVASVAAGASVVVGAGGVVGTAAVRGGAGRVERVSERPRRRSRGVLVGPFLRTTVSQSATLLMASGRREAPREGGGGEEGGFT